MVLVPVVISSLLICAAASLRRPSRLTAFLLVAICAFWLPVNNGRLEGPILLSIDAYHGLSTADLLAYGGFVLATVAIVRWWRAQLDRPAPAALRSGHPRLHTGVAACAALGVLVVVLGSGLAFAYAHQAV